VDAIISRIEESGVRFVKATYYWGDASPLNCWDSFRPDIVSSYMGKIAKDGFNTVILLIPLTLPLLEVEKPNYHRQFMDHLSLVFRECRARNLRVVYRLLYLWDMFPVEVDRVMRAFRFHGDTSERDDIMAYLDKLYSWSVGRPNFLFGFITWEDLLGHFIVKAPKGSREISRDAAKVLGWAGNGVDGCDALVPDENSPDMAKYLEFADQKFDQFYGKVKSVFPLLTAEVRVDYTPYKNKDGQYVFHNHSQMHALKSKIIGTYFAPYMGQQNIGDEISATEAFKAFKRVHQNVLDSAEKGVLFFVDQLLLVIEQKQFSHFSKIAKDQQHLFVELVADYLFKHGSGYACWAFRDYLFHRTANCSFIYKQEYWSITGQAQCDAGCLTCVAPVKLSQRLRNQNSQELPRFQGKGYLCIEGEFSHDAILAMYTADGQLQFNSSQFPPDGPLVHNICLDSPFISFELLSGEAKLKHISFGTEICSNGGYQLDFRPGPTLVHYKYLNELLSKESV
jgi:hypothetical protein